MLKDLSLSHFWILMRMGFDMQRIWDANYKEDDVNTLYLDYKDYVPRTKDVGKLYDYTRYEIYIPNRKITKQLTIRKQKDFDYEKYFKNNNLGLC